MAYNILHLDTPKLKSKLYLFDTNLWIRILKPAFYQKPRDEKYRKFFREFTESAANPKIALPTLVLSEVINRLMRDYAMNKYMAANDIDRSTITPWFYKDYYRNTDHFRQQYDLLCDDIKAFHNSYELVNDELGKSLMSRHMISHPPAGLDFNDYFFYQLAKKKGYSIITDDVDFFVEDVEILTFNDALYQKYKDTIKPIEGKS